MRSFAVFYGLLQAQRGHLFPWSPVLLGAGIACYFALRFEPDLSQLILAGATAIYLTGAAWWCSAEYRWLIWLVAFPALGFATAGARTHLLAAPVLEFRYYGPIEGRVVQVDRSARDAVRLTLDQLRLRNVAPDQYPAQVRITLHGLAELVQPGTEIMTTAHLMPPQGPAEPNGFDFRRHAWFQQVGAVGYTRVPVLIRAPGTPPGLFDRWRWQLSRSVQQHIPGQSGAFAAALTTGDRSGVDQATLDHLRHSNLAHLLAISGLHMGLLAACVYGLLRHGLCLVPPLALRLPVKKLAAIGALMVAAGYLGLSGGNIATERAFVMVAVMLVAVLLDRRAISLRAVAVAALIVLLRRPESLLSPGFQMSFAATTALVAVFGWIGDRPRWPRRGWTGWVMALLVSSSVAGLATAPFSAAHFNMLSQTGLLANLLAVPLMGALVIPASLLALVLYPIGLSAIGFWLMQQGLGWILWVAEWAGGVDGAIRPVPSPDGPVLAVFSLGALFCVVWQGPLRLAGLLPMGLALVIWQHSSRPLLLIDQNAALVGVLMEQGRALSKPKGAGFSAQIWLENDGDRVDQATAATRWPPGQGALPVGEWQLLHVIGKKRVALLRHCQPDQIIVTTVDTDLQGPCRIYDPRRLRDTGSLMMAPDGRILSAADVTGQRPWSSRSVRRRLHSGVLTAPGWRVGQ